jgi:hypothetical protein
MMKEPQGEKKRWRLQLFGGPEDGATIIVNAGWIGPWLVPYNEERYGPLTEAESENVQAATDPVGVYDWDRRQRKMTWRGWR